MFDHKYNGDYVLRVKYPIGDVEKYKDSTVGFSYNLFRSTYGSKQLLVYRNGILNKKIKFYDPYDIIELPKMDKFFTQYVNIFDDYDDTDVTVEIPHNLKFLDPSDLTSTGVYNLVKFVLKNPEYKEDLALMKSKNAELDDYLINGIKGAIRIAYDTGHLNYAKKLSIISLGLSSDQENSIK